MIKTADTAALSGGNASAVPSRDQVEGLGHETYVEFAESCVQHVALAFVITYHLDEHIA